MISLLHRIADIVLGTALRVLPIQLVGSPQSVVVTWMVYVVRLRYSCRVMHSRGGPSSVLVLVFEGAAVHTAFARHEGIAGSGSPLLQSRGPVLTSTSFPVLLCSLMTSSSPRLRKTFIYVAVPMHHLPPQVTPRHP